MSKYETNPPKVLTVAQQLEVAAHWLDEADMLAWVHKDQSMRDNFKRVARDCRAAMERAA